MSKGAASLLGLRAAQKLDQGPASKEDGCTPDPRWLRWHLLGFNPMGHGIYMKPGYELTTLIKRLSQVALAVFNPVL